MIVKKRASGQFAKQGADFKDGDIIKFVDAGTEQEGQHGMQTVFKFKFLSGEEKLLSINQTSINNLVDAYGEDTEQWVGKGAKIEILKQMVGGEIKQVNYLFPIATDSLPF